MSLFRRDDSPSEKDRAVVRLPEGAAGSAGAGHVATGSRIEGTIRGSADWLVDGELIGAVGIEGHLTVGPGGRIEGTIQARSIRLAGRVVGDLVAGERVEVVSTGHLEGNITAPRVIIAEGSFFKGSVAMATAGAKPGAKERKS